MTLNLPKNDLDLDLWSWRANSSDVLLRDFSPTYVTTKQKVDAIMLELSRGRTHRNTHTHLYPKHHMLVFMITSQLWKRQTSDRHTQLNTIASIYVASILKNFTINSYRPIKKFPEINRLNAVFKSAQRPKWNNQQASCSVDQWYVRKKFSKLIRLKVTHRRLRLLDIYIYIYLKISNARWSLRRYFEGARWSVAVGDHIRWALNVCDISTPYR